MNSTVEVPVVPPVAEIPAAVVTAEISVSVPKHEWVVVFQDSAGAVRIGRTQACTVEDVLTEFKNGNCENKRHTDTRGLLSVYRNRT